MNKLRTIKNIIVGNDFLLSSFITSINLPIIGNIYDFFYLKQVRKRIEESDLEVTIEPSNICNLKCVMCPYKRMTRKKEVMPIKLFKRIVDESADIGCKTVYLQQYNEPFLDKQIHERINYVREKGMKTLIYSNGMLLDIKMRRQILANPPTTIRFSVDGATKKTFESIRKGAHYETVVNNIQKLFAERNALGQKEPSIEVYFTLFKQNESESKQFLKQWKNHCDFASLYPADSRESGSFPPFKWKNKKAYPCFNPKSPIILSNGKIALCCVDVDGVVEIGDLKEESLKKIINSGKMKEIYESQMERRCSIGMCKNCSKLYIDSAFKWWVD